MRKTSRDYRKELNGFKKSVESTEAHVLSRLLTLIEKFPDATVMRKGYGEFKVKNVSPSWIESLSTDTQLDYIESIEEHTASLEPHYQVSMYE